MLNTINLFAAKKRKDDSIAITGEEIAILSDEGAHPNNSGLMMLWRGAQMLPEWISTYEQKIGERIYMSASNSCSRDLRMALTFAI